VILILIPSSLVRRGVPIYRDGVVKFSLLPFVPSSGRRGKTIL
jgi:hypothetical protein